MELELRLGIIMRRTAASRERKLNQLPFRVNFSRRERLWPKVRRKASRNSSREIV